MGGAAGGKPGEPKAEGIAGTDGGGALTGAGGRAGIAIGDGAGAGGAWAGVGMGIGALARCSANTRVGGGAAGGRGAARRPASAGSLSRSNSASMPWKTSWHCPQRTQPSETLSWSCTTRKIVPQVGQRVARLILESYDARRAI